MNDKTVNIKKIKKQRCKNYSQYFNNLVKKDFLEFLNLPADTSNEVIAQKWEEYKKENNL